MQKQLVQHLSTYFSDSRHQLSELDQDVYRFLKERKLSRLKAPFNSNPNEIDPASRIQLWRNLLKATLLSSLKNFQSDGKIDLQNHWYALYAANSLKDFQLEQAYSALTALLLDIPYEPQKEWIQLSTGLTPIESGGHWPLMNAPLIEWHAELGILFLLLGKKTGKASYITLAQKLAYWQTKTLDYEFKPHRGFFSSHHLGHCIDSQFRQALLFHGVSLATADPQMAFLAKHHFSDLLEMDPADLEGLSSDAALTLYWLDLLYSEELTAIEPKLTSKVLDPALAIAGYRSNEISVITSMVGSNMGLGSLRFGDIEIPSFGPQLKILGEGQLFGIAGQNPLKSTDEEKYQTDFDGESFHMRGKVGLPSTQENLSYFKRWNTIQNWMDCNICYEKGALDIQITPYEIDPKLFFVFYAGAQTCLVNGKDRILPHSLSQFHGKAMPITLVGEKGSLNLSSEPSLLDLKIIPLKGHPSFWGANYLIAYHLNNKYSTFKWKISPA